MKGGAGFRVLGEEGIGVLWGQGSTVWSTECGIWLKCVPSIGGVYRHAVAERPVDEGEVAAVGGPGELCGILRGHGEVALLRPGGGVVHTDVVAALVPLRYKEGEEGHRGGKAGGMPIQHALSVICITQNHP